MLPDELPCSGLPHYRYSWEFGEWLQVVIEGEDGVLFAVTLKEYREALAQERAKLH